MNDQDYQEPKDLNEFTTEELSEFSDQYEHLAQQIEGYIYQNKPLLEYINTRDNRSDRASFDSIKGFEYGSIQIQLSYGGCGRGCCPSYEYETSIPLDWITEGKWEAVVDKANAEKEKEKKAKERKKKADQRKRDKADLERLQKKLGKQA
jgi:hypothetical protein